jgi:mRNA interferase HigB
VLVHVISFKKLRAYFSKETNARVALQDWYKKATKAEWDNFADLRNTFNTADSVGNGRFVFNVKGNHYRVVAIVRFKFMKVLIGWVGNQRDYDKIKDIEKL